MNRLLVHPHFNSSGRINSVRVLVSGKRVRMEASENVPDPAARDGLDYAAALPHPERHLQVLAAPDVHGLIVGAGGPEILSPDAEQTARHHRRAVRPRTVLSHLDEDDKVEFSYCFAIFF